MLGDLLHLLQALAAGSLRLVAELVPRLHSRQQGLEPVELQPLQVGLGKEGQAALRDELDASAGRSGLDRVQDLVEPNAEVGVVPGNTRPLQRPQQEPQVVLEHSEIERLVRHDRIDAEAARVWAPKAGEHGDDLEDRCLSQGQLDVFPALAHAG